jgi:hypothetical protein
LATPCTACLRCRTLPEHPVARSQSPPRHLGDGPRELATRSLRPRAETPSPRSQEDASRLSCATNVLSRTPENCRPSSEGLASSCPPRCSRSSHPRHLAMPETPRTGLPRRCLVAVAGAFDLEWRCGG